MSARAAAVRRRRKADPYHGAKLAPAVRVPANVCARCGKPELICNCAKESTGPTERTAQ